MTVQDQAGLPGPDRAVVVVPGVLVPAVRVPAVPAVPARPLPARLGGGPPAVPAVPERPVIPRRAYVSPLAGGGHCLRGGVVTDRWEIAGIELRVAYYDLPVLARLRWRMRYGRPRDYGAPRPAPPKIIPTPVLELEAAR